MKRLPTNSRRGTSDVDLCPASPKRVPTGPQDPFGGRNSAVPDPIPVRVRQIVGVVRRNEGTIALKWLGDGAGEGQMGNVHRTLARFRSLFCLCANICPAEFEDNFQCCSSSVTRLFTQPGEGQVGVADVSPL